MFDIGFWEMALIAVVALIVVGPRDLPALLRSVGSWVGRARRMAGEFRDELSREVTQAEELKRLVEREAEIAELHKMLDEARAQIPLDPRQDDDRTDRRPSSYGEENPAGPRPPVAQEATPQAPRAQAGRERDDPPA